jgi:hypothetical protein
VGFSAEAWWLTLIALPFTGTVLAIVHAREDAIEWMTDFRWWPIRAIGRELMASSWSARLNLPGVLEGVGSLLVAWMVGNPEGPFANHPPEFLLGAVATLFYAWLAALHWFFDSTLYLPEGRGWSVVFARTVRALAPLGYAAAFSLLLSRNATGPLVTVTWLSAVMLLLYPAVVVYERFLLSAEIERQPAVMAQRLVDSTVVHASISNPLHFALMAARNNSAGSAEALLLYLRGELTRCLRTCLRRGGVPAWLRRRLDPLSPGA